MKFSSLIVILLISVAICSNHKAHHKNKKKYFTKIHKAPEEIVMTPEQIQEQEKKNEVANGIHSTDPSGRDLYDDIISEKLYFRHVGDENSTWKQYLFRLNKHSLYYTMADKSSSYRGIVESFSVKDMTTPDEDLNRCCRAVTLATQTQFKKDGNILSCIQITNQKNELEKWELCSSDKNIISFRMQLIVRIAAQEYVRRGEPVPNIVASNPTPGTPENWDWNMQADWSGTCQTGEFQSPINAVEEMAQEEIDSRLIWQYKPFTPTIKNNGHENVVTGAGMGHLFWYHTGENGDRNIQESVFTAHEVRFKFRSEHKINGQDYFAEMQIHHTYGKDSRDSEDADKAVLSVLLEADYTGEVPTEGTFLDALQFESNGQQYADLLNEEKTVKEFTFQTTAENYVSPSIENLVKGGATKYLRKSFYHYVGSETTPGCEQGVKHFVMAEPVKVPADLLDKVRRGTYDIYTFQNGNSRRMNEKWMESSIWAKGGSRLLSFHKDRSAPCPPLLDSEIKEAIKERMEEHKEQTISEEFDDLSSNTSTSEEGESMGQDAVGRPSFYKTTSHITSYGLSGSEPVVGTKSDGLTTLKEGLTFGQVNPTDVPEKTRDNLIHQANKFYAGQGLDALTHEQFGLNTQETASTTDRRRRRHH